MKKRNIVLVTSTILFTSLIITGVGFSSWFFYENKEKQTSLSVVIENKVSSDFNLTVDGPTSLSLDQPKITNNTVNQDSSFIWSDNGTSKNVIQFYLNPVVTGDTASTNNNIYVNFSLSLGANDEQMKKISKYFLFGVDKIQIQDLTNWLFFDANVNTDKNILSTNDMAINYEENTTYTLRLSIEKCLKYTDLVTSLDSNNKFKFASSDYKQMKKDLDGCSLVFSIEASYK